MPDPTLVSALAAAILAGAADAGAIADRLSRTLGRRWRWLRPLARRYATAIDGTTRPRQRDVVRFLREDRGFRRALRRYGDLLRIEQRIAEPPGLRPHAAAAGWRVPAIESVGDLAHWFGITSGELDWFADLKGLCRGAKLSHYRYRVVAKRSGALRLIEAPKPRLKDLQRRILTGLLERIPCHPAAHGFLKGRSIKTFVAPHVSRGVVLRMDLRDFFPSISAARVQALFRTAGYPEAVADLLGGICTHATPRAAWTGAANCDPLRLIEARALYARRHLPQGAPASPTLANLCAYRADCRLAGLAASAGAHYTRYADDLAFSGDGDFHARVERFSVHAAAILSEEGFAVNHRKTRIMRQAVRQRLAGLVVNQTVNVARADFDELKAILTNCARHGPHSQNRGGHPQFRAHLEGRVGHVESINARKGLRLRRIFERIEWP